MASGGRKGKATAAAVVETAADAPGKWITAICFVAQTAALNPLATPPANAPFPLFPEG